MRVPKSGVWAVVSLATMLSAGQLQAQTVQYQKVIETTLSKTDGYAAAAKWFAESFKDATNHVLVDKDATAGLLVGNGVVSGVGLFDAYDLHFTLTLEFKDNKARATFTNLAIPVTVGSATNPGTFTTEDQLKSVQPKLEGILKSLQDDLAKYNPNW